MTSGLRPRVTLDKPISPANLIKTICKILEIEPEAVKEMSEELTNDRGKLVKLIHETDSDTLRKIREMLNKE